MIGDQAANDDGENDDALASKKAVNQVLRCDRHRLSELTMKLADERSRWPTLAASEV
jgi:hypothetical protein